MVVLKALHNFSGSPKAPRPPQISTQLVLAALKLQLKCGRMVPSQPRLDVGKLKDERAAEEFANSLSGDLGGNGCFRES